MQVGIVDLTTDSLGEFTKQQDCLVLFHKKRCPNCKVLFKVLEKCRVQQPDLVVAAVDTESEKDLVERLDIARVPTVLVFKNGEQAASKTGVVRPDEMLNFYRNA